MGGMGDGDADPLCFLTAEGDFIDEQHRKVLHRMILGLQVNDLEEKSKENPESLDVLDAIGHTSLT